MAKKGRSYMKRIKASENKRIILGKVGENKSTVVKIPFPSDLIGYEMKLFYKIPNSLLSAEAPAENITAADGFIHWIITDDVTAKAGKVAFQIRFISGKQIVKSAVYEGVVLPSIYEL